MSDMQGNVEQRDYVQGHERALEALGVEYKETLKSEELEYWVAKENEGAKTLRAHIEDLTLYLSHKRTKEAEYRLDPDYSVAGNSQGTIDTIDDVQKRLFDALTTAVD